MASLLLLVASVLHLLPAAGFQRGAIQGGAHPGKGVSCLPVSQFCNSVKRRVSSLLSFTLKMFLRQLSDAAWGFSKDQVGK